jgi:hypothetical protein
MGSPDDVYNITTIESHYLNLEEELLPMLMGKVFHVTTKDACSSILTNKTIKNNMKGDYKFCFPQSENSYGRKRGYVCLFDLRSATKKHIQDASIKFNFLNPFRNKSDPCFFIISCSAWSQLIDASVAKSEIGYTEMWIPYVECWFPKNLSLDHVVEIIEVKIDYTLMNDFKKNMV